MKVIQHHVAPWQPTEGAWGCPVMPPPLGYCSTFTQAEEAATNKPRLPLPLGLKPLSTLDSLHLSHRLHSTNRENRPPQPQINHAYPDFQRLCLEQLDLFRRIVSPEVILSIYVRPDGSYVMDQLELRRVTSYLGVKAVDIVFLVGNFTIPAGLHIVEAVLSSQQMEVVGKHSAVVFSMVKHSFEVGFLVAELPEMEKVS
ncbi:hypothetical protein V6N13_015011 [Hibiscus sabdariffa]